MEKKLALVWGPGVSAVGLVNIRGRITGEVQDVEEHDIYHCRKQMMKNFGSSDKEEEEKGK